MRTLVLLGLLALAVARPARAQPAEPDEPPIELGPPPPPPPGARELEPDEPSAPPIEPKAAPVEPAPGEPAPGEPETAPLEPRNAPVSLDPEPDAATPRKRRLPAPAPSDEAALGRRDSARWYGWKILIADGGALVLTVSVELGPVLGGGAYLLTAPSIHLGHRRPLAALGSLGLRIAAPLALNALIEHEPCSQDPCLPAGVLAGALVASVVDVAFLAREGGDSKPKQAARIAPAVAAGPKGTTLFLTGSF